MARVTLNPGFPVPRSNQGGLVFRDYGDRLYLVKAPDFSHRVLSDDQNAQLSKFVRATRLAKQRLTEPEWRAACQRKARDAKTRLTAMAVHLAFQELDCGGSCIASRHARETGGKSGIQNEIHPAFRIPIIRARRKVDGRLFRGVLGFQTLPQQPVSCDEDKAHEWNHHAEAHGVDISDVAHERRRDGPAHDGHDDER